MSVLDLRAEAASYGLVLADAEALSPAEREIAIATWRGRMVNEHASARVFAGLLAQLMAAGVSAVRQSEVVGFAAEELRHGVQCAAAVHALGGDARATLPPLPPVPAHSDVSALEAVLRNVISISCLSETVAVALIGAEREQAGPPELGALLSTILADEVGHARFGWTLLDELSPQLAADEDLRWRLGDYLIGAFEHLVRFELSHLPDRAAPSALAEEYGVCDGRDARVLLRDTVTTVIVPQLEERGIPARQAFDAAAAGLFAL